MPNHMPSDLRCIQSYAPHTIDHMPDFHCHTEMHMKRSYMLETDLFVIYVPNSVIKQNAKDFSGHRAVIFDSIKQWLY
jgi:hypothetical protein